MADKISIPNRPVLSFVFSILPFFYCFRNENTNDGLLENESWRSPLVSQASFVQVYKLILVHDYKNEFVDERNLGIEDDLS